MLRPNLLKISESAFASGLREVIEIALSLSETLSGLAV
jgi:hypothetical protein